MTSNTYDRKRISKEFASWRVGVTPSAAEQIADADDPGALIEAIGAAIEDDDVSAVEIHHVETALQSMAAPSEGDATDEQTDATGDTETTHAPDDASADDGSDAENSDSDPDAESESDADSEAVEPSIDIDDSEVADESAESDERAETDGEGEQETVILEEAELDGEAGDEKPPRNVSNTRDGKRYIVGGDLIDGETPESRWPSAWDRTLVPPPLPEGASRDSDQRSVTITGDITDNSRTNGEYSDFQRLFRDRYKRLQKVLKDRMPPTTTASAIDERMARRSKPIGIIGIVNEVRKTKNGHDLVEIEDTTGTFPVLFSKDHTPEPIQDQIDRIIEDEVIGFVGDIADDAGIMFGNEIYFPDLPPMRVPNTADRPVKAVMLSDLHFGAVDFAAEEWHSFVEWMHTDPEAEAIEYILVAGDLVEGIGVYPGQEKELDVVDIYDQYVLCAEALKQLPDDVDIYTIMGNHDTVRLAEPQPVIKDAFKEPFADNVHFAGNPATFDVEGVKFLLYHGMSLNPFTDRTPGLDIHEPTDAMELMLEKRHLAPMYGMSVRLAPENEDYLVIEDVPDVLHTGHVHTFGVDTYKNVLMMNTGCWQYQTDFQRKLNVEPDVGLATIVDLETLNVEVKQF